MRNIQKIVDRMINDKKQHRRWVSLMLVFTILTGFAVPFEMIKPGVSMTISDIDFDDVIVGDGENAPIMIPNAANADGNVVDRVTYSPKEISLATLLFGEGTGVSWLGNNPTIDEALKRAQNEYFLGLASDFCAFIEGDFIVTNADTEGRVFVGGDIIFDRTDYDSNWNYQVGSGDFSTLTPLTLTDDFSLDNQRSNFAHIICGGKLYHVNTISTGNFDERDPNDKDKVGQEFYDSILTWHKNGNTLVYNPEQDMYKKLLVGNINESRYYDPSTKEDVEYKNSVIFEYPGTEENCESSKKHDYLKEVNQLAQIYSYSPDDIRTIQSKVFESVRNRSKSLSEFVDKTASEDGNTITFDGDNKAADVIYFKLDEWKDNYQEVKFINIPDGTSVIVNVGGESFNLIGDSGKKIKTSINNVVISNNSDTNNNLAHNLNNNVNSSRILYNFYEAKSGTINCNMNGTILAPNADVESDRKSCPGHLSGALIAKSFEGGLEFGYRPYRGSAEIVGTTSGYVVPVDKKDSNTKYHLSGAQFGLYDSTDKIISAWMSDGETEYVPIPLQVDFSGKTQYPTAPVPAQKPKNTEPADEETEENETDEIEIIEETTESTTSVETTLTETSAAVTETETVTAEIEETADIAEDEEQIEALSDITEENEAAEDELIIENEELLEVVYPNLLNVNDNEARTPLKTESASYKIKEISAPTGYIKTDDIINIEVSEKIYDVTSYNNNNGETSCFPIDVDIDVLIDSNPYHLNILDSRTDNQTVNRTITINDKTFTIDGTTKILSYEGTSYSTEGLVGNRYYYNPDIMMVIPLPESNITFENKPGLTFKKVDDSGNELKGATISFSGSNNTNTNWNWNTETSSCLIDISSLGNGTYTFTEGPAPSGYEIASDISFEKTGDYTIKINGENKDLPYTVEMVDQKIYGVKNLNIFKYNGNDGGTATPENALNGAKFNLYAKDRTIIAEDLESDEDGKIELNFSNSDKLRDNNYIKCGYLIPGVYYLRETKVPDSVGGKPFTTPDDIYFTLKNDFTIVNGETEIFVALGISIESQNVVCLVTPEGTKLIDGNAIGLTGKENVNYFEIEGNLSQVYFTDCSSDSASAPFKYTYTNPIDLKQAKIQCYNGKDATITKAIIKTTDNVTYVYPESYISELENSDTPINQSNLLTIATDTSVLQIANKSETKKNITVEKKWANDEGFESMRTSSVKVQLYRSTDVNDIGKTYDDNTRYNEAQVDLNAENNWKYTWENLDAYEEKTENGQTTYSPYYYYVEELDVPHGYTPYYETTGNTTIITNTLNTISVTAQKIWDTQDLSVSIPSSVTVKLQYQDGSTWKDTGKRLTLTGTGTIWTGTFEGLPSGKTYRIVEVKVPGGWKVQGEPRTTSVDNGIVSITNIPDVADLTLKKQWDGDDSGSVEKVTVKLYRVAEKNDDVVGGYHDAGDHVMFGLPQGFTASTLGWSYYEFEHTESDPSKKAYTALDQKKHFDIIFKRFADFFYNSVQTDENGNVSKLLVRKGIPGEEGVTGDHDYWGAPELQYSRAEEMTWATSAPDIASEYAATLAQYSIFYNDENAGKYLETAKKLYEFAKNESGRYNSDSAYYNSESFADDRAWAAGWMYLATREDKYKDDLSSKSYQDNEWGNYSWNDVGLGASVLYAEINSNWGDVTSWLNKYTKNNDYFYYGKWGSTRNNCGAQLVALVAAKHEQNADAYKAWSQNQMKYILGGQDVNSSIQARSYVIGFGENYPTHEHHRAASGTDSMHTSDESAHLLIGGMVGGPTNGNIGDKNSGSAPGRYNDVRWDYEGNEVALDYNAVLVGAAAGLYSLTQKGITDTTINGVQKVYGGGNGSAVENEWENYAKLLQYSLYFYDANMCGRDVDENSAFAWRGDCHTDDGIVQIKPAAPTPKSAPRVTRNVAHMLVDAVIPTAVNESQTEGQTTVKTSSRQRTMLSQSSMMAQLPLLFSAASPLGLDDDWKEGSDSEGNYIYYDNEFQLDSNSRTIPTGLDKKVSRIVVVIDAENSNYGVNINNDYFSSTNSYDKSNINKVVSEITFTSFQTWSTTKVIIKEIRIYYIDTFSIEPNHYDIGQGDDFTPTIIGATNPISWTVTNEWNTSNNFTISGNTFSINSGASKCKYTAVGIDANGREGSFTFTVGEPVGTFEVNPNRYELYPGKSCTPTITGNGSWDFTWTIVDSSNNDAKNYFEVSGTEFKAKDDAKPGNYTVRGKDSTRKTGEFTIEVKAYPKLTATKTSYEVEQGKTVQLELNNLVNGGELTLVDPPNGFRIIDGNKLKADSTVVTDNYTLKVMDENNSDSEKNNCEITVNVTAPIPQLVVSPTTKTVEQGESFDVQFTGYMRDTADIQLVNPPQGITYSNGKVTVASSTSTGTYNLTFKDNNNDKSPNNQCNLTVSVTEKLCPDGMVELAHQSITDWHGSNEDNSLLRVDFGNMYSGKCLKIVLSGALQSGDGHGYNFNMLNDAGSDQINDRQLTDWKTYSGQSVIVYDFSNPKDIEKFNLLLKINPDKGVTVTDVYFFGDKPTTFNIKTNNTEVLSNEEIELQINGATGALNWNNGINVTESDGKYYYTVPLYDSDNHTITISATDSDDPPKTGSCTINVIDFRLQSDSIIVKAGGTATIQVDTKTDGAFEFKVNGQNVDETKFRITPDGNTILVEGIEATDSPITVTATKNGYSKTFTVQVTNGMRIVEKDKNPSESSHDIFLDGVLQLETQFAPGSTVEWRVDSEIAEIDQTGKLTAKKFGTVTVTAKSGDETASYIVNIKSIPSNAVEVDTYTISKDGKWECVVENLPRTDSDGNEYIYYLVEETSNGYIPIGYSNGTKLSGNSSSLSVTNKLSKSLPETGSFGTTKIKIVGVSIMILAAFELNITHKRRRRKWSGA